MTTTARPLGCQHTDGSDIVDAATGKLICGACGLHQDPGDSFYNCNGFCSSCGDYGFTGLRACSLACAYRLTIERPFVPVALERPWRLMLSKLFVASPQTCWPGICAGGPDPEVWTYAFVPADCASRAELSSAGWKLLVFASVAGACPDGLRAFLNMEHNDLARAWESSPHAGYMLWLAYYACPDRRAPVAASIAIARRALVALDGPAFAQRRARAVRHLELAEGLLRGTVSGEDAVAELTASAYPEKPLEDRAAKGFAAAVAAFCAEESARVTAETALLDLPMGRVCWEWTMPERVVASAEAALRLTLWPNATPDKFSTKSFALADEVRRHVHWGALLEFVRSQDSALSLR